MTIDESMLGTEPLEIREEIPADKLGLGEEAGLTISELVFEGTASKFDRGVRITGTIAGSVIGPCARCLEDFERECLISFRSDFIGKEYFNESAEAEIGRDELDADVLPEGPIDIAEVVREQIILAEPERQVCGPECKGLCSNCGANLNSGECGCRDEDIDPRWEALKKLKKEI
jgi:uncharacterized protein